MLRSLSISRKLILVLIIPIAGLIGFSGFNVVKQYQLSTNMAEIDRLAGLAPTISALAHEMQKERGASAGFIASKGDTAFKTRLEKQRALIAAGWPKSALLITVAKDVKNAGHAVLTVRTDQGDMILDNQVEAVLPWYATPYRYIKRQSTRAPAKWTGISDTRVTTVSSVGR